MNPQKFASELSLIYENELESVVLYGSAADGEFHKGLSDYNIIIVLKNLAPLEIAKANKAVKKWVKAGNPPPLFFSSQIIKDAADVFPIEFYDIKERHKVLYGWGPFADITIDPKNLRHQCEHELRSKLLALRSRLAMLADRPKDLIKLILESSSSFFAIFGGIIRLGGGKPAPSKKELAEQIGLLAGADPVIFGEILDVREGTKVWRKGEALEKFEQYLTSIEAVVRYVDKEAKI